MSQRIQNEAKSNRRVLLFILLSGSFLSVLNQTILTVALPEFMGEFDINATTVQWLTTGYMLVNGILIPVTAYLMNRFTTRQLFISSMLFLLLGSILAASSPNFTLLLTGRLVQASGAGIIMPLLMAVIYEIFPINNRGSAMGMIGLTMAFAPAIAPSLAGIVIEHVSWRWLFIGMIPLLGIVILLSFKYLFNVSETSKPKADIPGIIYSTLGFGGILYGFSNASGSGWGNIVVLSCLIGGGAFLVLFCTRQLKSSNPMLDLRVFSNKTYLLTTIINTLVTIIMYADIILVPLYLQSSMGYTALESGLLLLPGALLMAVMSPITGRLFDKFGPRILMLTGLVFVIIAVWGVTNLSVTTSYTYLMIRTIVLRLGLSLLVMPVTTAGLNALPQKWTAHGSAVTNTVRQVAGAIGTTLVVTVMTISSSHHLTKLMQSDPSFSQTQLAQESSILGTSDAFIYIVFVGIIAFILTLFMPKQKSGSKQEISNSQSPSRADA
ncbi:drug resistance transporter, EmrB/QacA subfamily [Paenibacillus uliginis N3/975]|uniref:Drug resistance transporter, EmrB/QacA subfamily n=1 Tax=Paenibacillus uliginis N3/975 TaxID=1313296 RepID=A0A1X7HE81_9BACL|nr:DHA2 family efflux MFS transporter permease subunit [Paenibacillus uliginis]SMF84930.1 drug resistance transporter, EmrB/QacA subfamily [Paenibacillus uliginis N3/975]